VGKTVGAFARWAVDQSPQTLQDDYDLDRRAANNLVEFLREQQQATRVIPSDRTIVIERFRDELGDWRIAVLSPFGARVHAPWALGIEAKIRDRRGCGVLLVGYINRDAKRRGMSPTLWTIVAVIIPNALGIILYFILRQPRSGACPQCACAVQTGFNFCPRCSYKLSPSCLQCQRVVGVNDVFCPYCGASLRNQAAQPSGLATE